MSLRGLLVMGESSGGLGPLTMDMATDVAIL